jgi:hypothetical protein
LKINQAFEIGGRAVKFTFMSRFAIKFIEVAGARDRERALRLFPGANREGARAYNRGRPNLARDD